MNLNKCTSNDLSTAVPEITTVLANRIIAYRRRKQRFRSVEDVLEVRGMTPEILKTLSKQATVGRAGRTKQPVPKSSPRLVLVVGKNSEKWVEDGNANKGSNKPVKLKKPATRKSTPRPKPAKRKSTPRPKPAVSRRSTKPGKSAQKSRSSGGGTAELIKPSTTSSAKRGGPRRKSVSAVRPNKRRSNIPVAKSKSFPCPPPSLSLKSAEFVAQEKLKRKPPTGRRPVIKSTISTRSARKSNSRSPAIAKRVVSHPVSMRTRHDHSTVVSGSTPRETASAHLENCYVAVHSTPKGKRSPIVTVDINPTSPNFSPPKSGDNSPGRRRRTLRLSPIRRVEKDSDLPTSTRRRRSSDSRPSRAAAATGQSATSAKADVSPISVSESLDELLASSRETSRGDKSRRTGGSSQASERVSMWLEDNSRFTISSTDGVNRANQRTPTSMTNDTTRACNSRMREFSPSPVHSGSICKRALESDFEDATSPARSTGRIRHNAGSNMCSCGKSGVCRKCGKVKTPRRRHRAGSQQDERVEPQLLTWCNIL